MTDLDVRQARPSFAVPRSSDDVEDEEIGAPNGDRPEVVEYRVPNGVKNVRDEDCEDVVPVEHEVACMVTRLFVCWLRQKIDR